MKRLILFGSSVLLMIILVSAVAFINNKNAVPESHIEVVLRNVGHQLLLRAKDSTSRVLPVKKLNKNTYQLSFQKNFSFISDTLINLVERDLERSGLATGYIVSLKNCEQEQTVLAFELNKEATDLTPCRGRTLEVGCYVIDIELLHSDQFNLAWLLLLIIPFGIAGFYFLNKRSTKEEIPVIDDDKEYLVLGNFRFYPDNNLLKLDNNSITLSEKESKALKIFSDNINQVVERDKLMKDLWEDEGVVVISRNVDVLVSKLRKKLAADTSIKIINVHGKGYRFTV